MANIGILLSLGLQLLGSILLALDVFDTSVREKIENKAQSAWDNKVRTALFLMLIMLFLTPVSWKGPSQFRPKISEIESLVDYWLLVKYIVTESYVEVTLGENILLTVRYKDIFGFLEKFALLDEWIALPFHKIIIPVFGSRPLWFVIVCIMILIFLFILNVYSVGFYSYNKISDSDEVEHLINPLLYYEKIPGKSDDPYAYLDKIDYLEADLTMLTHLFLAIIFFGLFLVFLPHILPVLVLYGIHFLSIIILAIGSVIPLIIGYRLEDSNVVTSGLRFAGFILLAVGFVSQIILNLLSP